MIESLERFLQCEWPVFCPGQRPPRRVRLAMLSSSRERDGTRVLLAFGDGWAEPAMVARIPRQPSGASRLEREWRLLQQVWASLPEGVAHAVPEPLCRTTVRGMPVFVQRALRGRNLKTLIQRGQRAVSRKRLEQDLAQMEGWLAGFQQARLPDRDPPGLVIPRLPGLEARLRASETAFVRARLVSRRDTGRLVARARALDTAFASRPLSWVHGDLWPGNIMEHGRRWGVIDWDSVAIGPSWLDRVWFAVHIAALDYARNTGNPDLRVALRRVLFDDHPFTQAVRRYLEAVFAPGRESGVTHRDALLVLLACHAAEVLAGRETRRVFALAAPELLRCWMDGASSVRI